MTFRTEKHLPNYVAPITQSRDNVLISNNDELATYRSRFNGAGNPQS